MFKQKGDILKNQLTFKNCGMTFRQFKDGEDFVKNYPFAPYQFQLLQKIFEAIRKAGATGMHLARGERSMLDAFQSAAKTVSVNEVGILVPLYDFYPSIESFLDTSVKKTIDQAETNPSLEPFDIHLLQVLFLIRYVDEMKGNVDNLVTLCLDQIDADRLALRRKIEESLARLEKETLISRSGDNYFFLTNEERDINKEIKAVESVERRGGQAARRDHLRRRAEGAAQAPLQRQQDGLRLQPALRPATPSATRRTGPCSSRSSRRWPTTTRLTRKASASSKAPPRAATS